MQLHSIKVWLEYHEVPMKAFLHVLQVPVQKTALMLTQAAGECPQAALFCAHQFAVLHRSQCARPVRDKKHKTSSLLHALA